MCMYIYLFQFFRIFGVFYLFRKLIFQFLDFIFTLLLLLDLLLPQLINLLHYNLLHLSLKIIFLFFFQHLIFKLILINRLLEIDCLKLSFSEKLEFTNNEGVELESLLVFIQIGLMGPCSALFLLIPQILFLYAFRFQIFYTFLIFTMSEFFPLK